VHARAAALAEKAERARDRDPVEPRPVARVTSERVSVAIGEQQRFLRDVVRIRGALENLANDREDETTAKTKARCSGANATDSAISFTVNEKTFNSIENVAVFRSCG
jgi:hypothetical protein